MSTPLPTAVENAKALELITHPDLFAEGDIPVQLVAQALAEARQQGRDEQRATDLRLTRDLLAALRCGVDALEHM